MFPFYENSIECLKLEVHFLDKKKKKNQKKMKYHDIMH